MDEMGVAEVRERLLDGEHIIPVEEFKEYLDRYVADQKPGIFRRMSRVVAGKWMAFRLGLLTLTASVLGFELEHWMAFNSAIKERDYIFRDGIFVRGMYSMFLELFLSNRPQLVETEGVAEEMKAVLDVHNQVVRGFEAVAEWIDSGRGEAIQNIQNLKARCAFEEAFVLEQQFAEKETKVLTFLVNQRMWLCK